MIFREIIEALAGRCGLEIISDKIEEEITEVRFIDSRQQQFRTDVLYFGNSIQSDQQLPAQCVVTGIDGPREMMCLSGNVAAVTPEDFGFAFNSAFQMVEDSHKDGYYESMMNTLERVKDVDTLIDIGSQTFGASLIFIDREFRILSYSTQIPVTDELWKKNIEQGYCDYEFIEQVKSLKSVQMADSTMMPIEVSCPSSPFQKFSCRVYCRDIWVGFLIVIENYDSYRPEHVEMLRILSGVLGYAVMKYEPNYLYMTSDYHRFLYNLIIGADASSQPEAYTQFSFPSDLIVLYCKATDEPGQFPQEGSLFEAMSSIIPGCQVIARRSSATIIGGVEILRKIGAVYSAFPEKCRVRIGVSLTFASISDLRAHYIEARDAYEIGVVLDPDNRIYTFEDYGMYVMFKKAAAEDNLSRYLHPAIPKLAAYDRENGTGLETTLHTYLKLACNATDTANALFLHRNSVIYRLHRIEELCDIDLNDTDVRFRLRLSFAISNVINGRRLWSGKDLEKPKSSHKDG